MYGSSECSESSGSSPFDLRKPLLLCVFVACCFWILVAASARADEPASAVKFDQAAIIERFKFHDNMEWAVAPVTMDKKTYTFVVDTGATRTVFHKSLAVGPAKSVSAVFTSNSTVNVDIVDTPRAQIQNLHLDKYIAEAYAIDLKDIRDKYTEIFGILGIDFLRQFIVHFDFDRREWYLLREIQTESNGIPLSWSTTALPQVTVEIGDSVPEKFAIDSGMASLNSGKLRRGLFWNLLDSKDARLVDVTPTVGLDGERDSKVAQYSTLRLGGFTIRSPAFEEANLNCLSLHTLSRFTVTFDFPKNRMYLTPGKNFEIPDPINLSGIHLIARDTRVIVYRVRRYSPGEKSRIRVDDVILKVAGVDATAENLDDIRTHFYSEGKVTVLLRRDDIEREVQLELKLPD